MAKNFIKQAINPKNKGQFKAKAKRAGKSTAQFAQQEATAPGKLGKQARLAKTLMGLNKGKKAAKKKPSKPAKSPEDQFDSNEYGDVNY
jgi:hypothetical protein